MSETMRERFISVVGDLLDLDEKTVVVLAVISHSLFADSGIEARHPERVIDVGIREQAQIGVAAGLALEGFKPIVTGYAPFLVERTFEQVKLDFHHQGSTAILASVGGSWDASEWGRTHQAPEDVALMASLRSWTIHVPGHPDELEASLRRTHSTGARTYIRMTTDSNSTVHINEPSQVVTIKRGSNGAPTVLAVGPIADDVLAAAQDLDLTVAYTITPHPIDPIGLRAAVTGTDVLLVEPYLSGTSSAQIIEAFADRPIRLRTHGVNQVDIRHYGSPAEHRKQHGLDIAGIHAFLKGEKAQPAVHSIT